MVAVLIADGAWATEQREMGVRTETWGSLTFPVLAQLGLVAREDDDFRELKQMSDGPNVMLARGDRSRLILDRESGAVILDLVDRQDRHVFDRILRAVVVEPPPAGVSKWPYEGDPPDGSQQGWYMISYMRPADASGMVVHEMYRYGGTPSIYVRSRLSNMSIDAASGLIDGAHIVSEDIAAFAQFYSTVKVLPSIP